MVFFCKRQQNESCFFKIWIFEILCQKFFQRKNSIDQCQFSPNQKKKQKSSIIIDITGNLNDNNNKKIKKMKEKVRKLGIQKKKIEILFKCYQE